MASGSTAGTDDDYEALISTTDVELLKRVWRNEKAAPEILRFESALIQRTIGQIQLMVTSQTLKNSNISLWFPGKYRKKKKKISKFQNSTLFLCKFGCVKFTL